MQKLSSVILETGEGIYFTSKTETLSSVEDKFLTPKKIIIIENNLTNLNVSSRALYVKKRSNLYVIKPTDTIKNLQEKFSISIENLYKINKTNYFYPGQKILTKDE